MVLTGRTGDIRAPGQIAAAAASAARATVPAEARSNVSAQLLVCDSETDLSPA